MTGLAHKNFTVTSNASIPVIEENCADLDIPFPGEDLADQKTADTNSASNVSSPSSQKSAINAVANIKLPSMTQVYELASSVGTCIEPLNAGLEIE